MATGENTRPARYYGPWRGISEYSGEAEAGHLEDAWNIDIDGSDLVTRGGRAALITSPKIFPCMALKFGAEGVAAARLDFTNDVTDGDPSTYADLSRQGFNALDGFWLGFAAPVDNVVFTTSVVNLNAGTLAVTYPQADGGMGTVASLADATHCFRTAGTRAVTFTAPADWRPTNLPTSFITGGAPGSVNRFGSLYWLRFSFSAAMSADVRVSQVTSQLATASNTLFPLNGVFQWRRQNGERLLYVGMDDTRLGLARLFVLDRFLNILRSVFIPAEVAKSGPDAQWVFAPVLNSLVATNGYTFLHTLPDNSLAMTPVRSAPLVAGASFTSTVPAQVKHLAFFAGRLLAVSRNDPNRVRYSDVVFDYQNVQASSVSRLPLLGCHVWRDRNDFGCMDSTGGPITGLIPLENSCFVFTSRSTQSVDPGAFAAGEGAASARVIEPDVGCVATGSLATADNNVFFLGQRGVYVNSGGKNILISRAIEPTIRRLNKMAIGSATAAVYQKRGQYRLFVAAGADNRNNLGLIWDLNAKAWTKYGVPPFITPGLHKAYQVKQLVSIRDEEWGEELLSAPYDATDGTLVTEDIGRTDMGSNAAAPILTLIVFHRNKAEDQSVASLRYIRVELETRGGAGGLKLTLLREGRTWRRRSISTPSLYDPSASASPKDTVVLSQLDDTKDLTEAQQVYDYGAGTGAQMFLDSWRARRLVSVRASVGDNTGREFQLVIYNSDSLATGMINVLRLRGVEFDFKPRDERR